MHCAQKQIVSLCTAALTLLCAVCCARFVPLRDAAGYRTESLAPTKVTDKDVKILALAIDATTKETGLLVEAHEPADGPDAESRASDEPENNETRQGNEPEAQPRDGAALPP